MKITTKPRKLIAANVLLALIMALVAVLAPLSAAHADSLDSGVQTQAASSNSKTKCRYYVAQKGDTLTYIAKRYGVTVNTLVRANNVKDRNHITIGQRLCVPVRVKAKPKSKPAPEPPTDSPSVPPDSEPESSLWTPPDQAIEVFSPVADGVYHSPIDINGFSLTFEGAVNILLLDSNGEIIGERMTMGGGVDHQFFSTYIRFYTDTAQIAKLMVYEIDNMSGGSINEVEIPITIVPGQRFVDVNAPTVGEDVCNPFTILGYSDTFEANVVVTLSERDGTEVETSSTMGGSINIYGDYGYEFDAPSAEAQALLVSAYEVSAMDGKPIDQTRVPISLWPEDSPKCGPIETPGKG